MRHIMTEHATRRAQQRAACEDAIEATINYGTEYRQPGRTAFYLGKRQVAAALRFGVNLRRFERTAVVLADDGAIVTVIRSAHTRKLRCVAEHRTRRFAS